eukprot:Nitzschia sp. Nitz4//scaffold34_size148208//129444//134234//NITZ4_002995-RA/size148208-processed-gene-0.55-mRNA-1//-1//CDS//3329548840//1004//frame0
MEDSSNTQQVAAPEDVKDKKTTSEVQPDSDVLTDKAGKDSTEVDPVETKEEASADANPAEVPREETSAKCEAKSEEEISTPSDPSSQELPGTEKIKSGEAEDDKKMDSAGTNGDTEASGEPPVVKSEDGTTTEAPTASNEAPNEEVVSEEAVKEESAPESNVDHRIGRILEQNRVLPSGLILPVEGKVVAQQEMDGRLPPRYTVQWKAAEGQSFHDEWTPADLDAETLPVGDHKIVLDNLYQRYQEHVQQELEKSEILSTLFIYAAFEEALQTNLQTQNAGGEDFSKGGGKNSQHPALYYSTNPSSYLKAPTATDTAPDASNKQVQMTASSLAHRVRAGCQWAWKYLQAQQPPPPPVNTSNNRRSLRQPRAPTGPTVPMPTPVQQGGRVAMWWIEKLQEVVEEKEPSTPDEEAPEKEAVEEPVPEKKASKKKKGKLASKRTKASKSNDDPSLEEVVDDNEEDEEDEGEQEDDDDDYASRDADMEEEDDDELEDVEKEHRGTLALSPVEDEEDMDVDEEESEEDIEHAVVAENPYLKPSFVSFLEYLAQPKALSSEDVQTAMSDVLVRVKFNKRSASNGLTTDTLASVDQVVLDQETPNFPPGKVVLKCISEEKFSDIQKLDAQAFGRSKFTLDVIGDAESTMQVQRRQELALQEEQFKEERAWAKWRYKSIHEGYAVWPSWHDGAAKWVSENTAPDVDEGVGASQEATAAAPDTGTLDDEKLAKSLDEQEAVGGRRRTARRAAAGASEGVYYGNQSQLSQKQLMDALIRLVKSNSFQTLFRLQALVADDSNDPVRRARVALGRLIWKRNQLLRKPMISELSDESIQEVLSKAPLLTVPPVVTDVAEAPEPPELTEDEIILRDYVRDLHKTELQLRYLVTKHMGDIPIAVIATAADERPGSMEAMDNADFEDPSSIEWLKSGHALLKKLIFRPTSAFSATTDSTQCRWYLTVEYADAIDSEAEEKEEPDSKARRSRFKAVPVPAPGENATDHQEVLILTEAQVHAGAKAAELEQEQLKLTATGGNPFSGACGDRVTLVAVDVDNDQDATEIHGRIVGYDNIVPEEDDDVENRILILPDLGDAFWATLDVRADTSSYVCQPVGGSTTWYSIEQFDYHQSSDAYQQCEAVLTYLKRQNKAGPFMHPVDPVALNIPTYPQIVKNPMDISTITDKLANGQYSAILPGSTKGSSPVARMLNGPFRRDIELMFDNAMLFNPPDDWIYQAAAQLKRSTLKKIADLSQSAEQKAASGTGGGRSRRNYSVYVDEDSDVDMYEYESDQDDDFESGGKKARKRKRSSQGSWNKEELAARTIEQPVRLQNTMKDPTNLRGPFANIPLNMTASSFSLSKDWSCRFASHENHSADPEPNSTAQEMAELLALQKVVQENEAAGLRRSTRAHLPSGTESRKNGAGGSIEYYLKDAGDSHPSKDMPPAASRTDVEVLSEKLHETYYAQLFQQLGSHLASENYGEYTNGSFPPYLGHVVPNASANDLSWEIRAPFVVPALRWVLRGLVNSGHLTAMDPLTPDFSSGVLLSNDIYYCDSSIQPFEVLDLRELQRKKRAVKTGESESEEELEMSEYEKARAERVARNAERLKALGLA